MNNSNPHILQENKSKLIQSLNSIGNNIDEEYEDMDEMLKKIEMLEDYQKKYESQGKYMEAEKNKGLVKQLKEKFFKQIIQETENKHEQELMEVDKQHLQSFHDFNLDWDLKTEDYLAQAQEFQKELHLRHREENEQFAQELDNCIPMNTKETSEMLNLKKIQMQLAKNQNYQEAHKVQQKYQALEQEQNQKYLDKREQKIRNLQKQLNQKHENEVQALQKKIQSGLNQQKKLRTQEMQRMMQKYNNTKSELEAQQKLQLQRLDKDYSHLVTHRHKDNTTLTKNYTSRYMSTTSNKFKENLRTSRI